jgi:tRNA threonylcarbamoyladenosine biosynthesis protein TsaE
MNVPRPFTANFDLEEMDSFARDLAKEIQAGQVITLSGDLGAGKTTFTKMLCKHLSIHSMISSPTYTYLNIYDDKVAHFDLYRLKNPEDFFALGFEEYIDSPYIVIIEWPEKIFTYLPKNTINICCKHSGNKREITING